MSKLLTDSETLMYWLKAGVSADDCQLCYMIKNLKQAIVDIAILQPDVDEQQVETLRSVNETIVTILRDLQSLKSDFQDIIGAK